MPDTNYTIFILLAVTVLSIIISVSAWFFLSSIGAKLSNIERETEKRSLEFDALRKDHLTRNQPPTGATVIEDEEPSISSHQHVPQSNMMDTIQIFRNVRGSYEDSEAASDNAVQKQLPNQAENKSVLDVPPPPPTSFDQIAPPPPNETPATPLNSKPETVPLFLYSDVTKDADFQSLWKNITTVIQSNHTARITIDLSNINFLYEKEMDYLEKINYLISKQGGALTLINCDKDLLTLINRKPHLGSIVSL